MPEKRNTHRQPLALLEQHQAHYRVVKHGGWGNVRPCRRFAVPLWARGKSAGL